MTTHKGQSKVMEQRPLTGSLLELESGGVKYSYISVMPD